MSESDQDNGAGPSLMRVRTFRFPRRLIISQRCSYRNLMGFLQRIEWFFTCRTWQVNPLWIATGTKIVAVLKAVPLFVLIDLAGECMRTEYINTHPNFQTVSRSQPTKVSECQ